MPTNPAPPELPVPARDSQTPLNHAGRMIGVLVSPKATFEDIVRRPTWIAPIVLLTVLTLGVTLVFSRRVSWERFMTQRFEENPRTAQMPPEQRQQALERATSFAKVGGFVGSVVSYLLIAVVVGGILMGAFNVFTGAQIRYSTALGIVSHAYIPGAIASALGILILFLKSPETINLENLLASNVGAFLSSDAPKWQQRLGTSLDLFSFWTIFLLATGFPAANRRKVSMGAALVVVLVIWAAYVFVRVAITAAFS